MAVEFSLLLSMPAVAGAGLLVALESGGTLQEGDAAALGVGFAAAFVTGMAALRALQWVVTRRKLAPFAIYCATLGGGAVLLG